jgi:hypothetical protein
MCWKSSVRRINDEITQRGGISSNGSEKFYWEDQGLDAEHCVFTAILYSISVAPSVNN